MFNVARSPTARYESLNGLGASFVADPLATSVYDNEVDPWSGVATPELVEPSSGVSTILGNAQIPPLYAQAWNTVDALGSGSVSINSLQRVISTANIPATSTEQIVNLVTSKSKVNKSEFYVALALVALSQQGKDVTIENVVSLAKDNQLPIPELDTSALNTIAASTVKSTFPPPRPGPVYNNEPDPWTAGSRGAWDTTRAGHATASILNSGLPPQWWKGLEQINVTLYGQQGPFFNRYMVYSVHSFSRGAAVHRRYSEFAFLWDVLVRRYPFRILPQLPPKRIGPDESFIEQRRKGLIRFLNFVVNHPVIKDDGVLAVFLSEPDFEAWKRRTPISYDEESTAKRVDRMDEMSIPSNLEEKLATTRQRIGMLIEQWTRICVITERVVKRREAAASDIARTTLSLNALTEGSGASDVWGLPTSQLAIGVRLGVENVSGHLNTLADTIEQRSRVAINNNVEALKMQRDLYVAVRDLFSRHDKYAPDNADRLRKRVETQSQKLENVKAAQANGWEAEAEKLTSSIEKDRAAIVACLARRVFIRSCLWHEFRVVYHNREHALLSLAIQTWAAQERDFNEGTLRIWNAMVDSVQNMPYE